uniref:Uncharacterized protein n=1 Tax=Setaria digitata TaxID=48799 RepID=A0A915PLY6_9BILA
MSAVNSGVLQQNCIGKTDDGAWKLAELLGWKAELEELIETELKKIDKKETVKRKSVISNIAVTSNNNNGDELDNKPGRGSESTDEKLN